MRFDFLSLRSGALGALVLGLAAPVRAQNVVANAHSPSLSPDGRRMVFARRIGRNWRLFVGDASGNGARLIGRAGQTAGDDLEPNWRADGQLIAFASNRGGNFDLFTVRPDGSQLRQITRTREDERDPQWSPRPTGLMEGEASDFVPNRSLKGAGASDLKLLQLLAGDKDAAGRYEKSSELGGYFNTAPLQRYYKLLCTQGKPGAEQIVLMREDGSLRFQVRSGMADAQRRPCWERTARTIAFTRRVGAQEVLYTSAAPAYSGEELEAGHQADPRNIVVANGQKYVVSVPTLDSNSVKRTAVVPPGAALSWTPNGEFIAVASGRSLKLVPRRDLKAATNQEIVVPLPGATEGVSLGWAKDARTALVTTRGAGATSSVRRIALRDGLLDVVNWLDFSTPYDDEYGALKRPDRAYLARQSFVAAGQGRKQMFHIYEETDYENLPVFVSSDSLLHLNHLVFDYVFRSVESEHLLPEVIELTRFYLQASIRQCQTAPDAAKSAAQANAAFFAVAARLALGDVKTGLPDDVPSPTAAEGSLEEEHREATAAAQQKRLAVLKGLTAPLEATLATLPPASRALAEQELALIREHKERAPSPIFGGVLTQPEDPNQTISDTRIDYSDFVPRGHYTRTEILRRYFLMSRWLAAGPFRASASGVRQSLLLVAATDATTLGRLSKVTQVIADFVGGADDQELSQHVRIARQVFGPSLQMADLSDAAKVAAFTARIEALPGPKIAATSGAALRFLPQPYTFDAEIMQNLVYDSIPPDVGTNAAPRYFALGLDVMGVLGSNRARSILNGLQFQGQFFDLQLRETQYANYNAQFNAQRAQVAAMRAGDWKRNLYNRTLYAMRPLLAPQSVPQFRFTHSPAWTDKQLNAALATWAELKHDTLPKQPVAVEAGGDSGLSEAVLLEQPQGFVEPSPLVYARLSELVAAERGVLAKSGYLSPALGQRLDTFAALLSLIARLEAKQRAGTPWTPGEAEQLRFYGIFQEHLTLASLEGQSESLEDTDMAIIADVAAAYSTRLEKQLVLEEGVGHALPVYVAVERNGVRTLTRGAIFTYYEFTHPAADRLADRKWQEYLASPDRPKQPAWTSSFVGTHVEK